MTEAEHATAAETHLAPAPEGPARIPGRRAPSWRTRDCMQAARTETSPCNSPQGSRIYHLH
jgi:hypothetical protein